MIAAEQARMLSRCWITTVGRSQITTPQLAEPDRIHNNVERQREKTERIKERERDPERTVLNKNCLSLALQSWNPLSQLSGWPTSREPQWPADFPGFGAQRVGSRPPHHPEYPHHPSSLLHARGLPFRLIVNGCCRRLNQEPARLNNRIHGWIYVCTHTCPTNPGDVSQQSQPCQIRMPSSGVIGVLLQAQPHTCTLWWRRGQCLSLYSDIDLKSFHQTFPPQQQEVRVILWGKGYWRWHFLNWKSVKH